LPTNILAQLGHQDPRFIACADEFHLCPSLQIHVSLWLDVRFYEQVYEEINGWHDLTQIQNRVAKRLYPTLEKKIDKLKAG